MNYNTDDRLYPYALEAMYTHAQQSPETDVCYSNCAWTHDPTFQKMEGFYKWMEVTMDNLLYGGCCVGPFPLLKKDSIIKAGKFDPSFKISGDYEMWCRMVSQGAKFKKVQDVIGAFYINPVGVSSNEDTMREHIEEDTLIRKTHGFVSSLQRGV